MTFEKAVSNYGTAQRADTFLLAGELFKGGLIVETGTMRSGLDAGDGASTFIFGTLAKERGTKLVSIDLDAEHVANSKAICKDLPVEFLCGDSVDMLATIAGPIGLAYLDSVDYIVPVENAQRHQLAEVGALWKKWADCMFLLLDDCEFPKLGKAHMSAPWLEWKGCKLIKAGYQRLYELR